MYQVIDSNGAPGEPVDMNVLRQWASEGKVTAGTMLLDPITGLTAPAGDMLTTHELFTSPTGEAVVSGIPPPLQSEHTGFSSPVPEQRIGSEFSASPSMQTEPAGFSTVAPQQPVEAGFTETPPQSSGLVFSSPPPSSGLDFSSQPPLQAEAHLSSVPPSQTSVAPIPPPSQSYIPTGGFTPQTYPNAAPLLNRFLGLLIDMLIAIPLVIMAVIPFVGLLGAPLLVAYLLSRDSIMNGQSVGKKVMGERVVRTDGQPFTWKDSALRNITYAPYLLMAIPFLGPVLGGMITGLCMIADAVCVLATQKRLGEYINNTMVVSDQG